MDKRKKIINEYKERKIIGGVYTITNPLNGMYLIDHAANLKSVENHFQFAMTTGSTVHPKLQKEWKKSGVQAFRLDILETLEQKPDQSQVDFLNDLKTLEQLCRATLDPAKEY